MSDWQDIKTAPKDGHRILLAGVNSHVSWISIGSWYSRGQFFGDDDMRRHPPAALREPTHWQPLPPPPEK